MSDISLTSDLTIDKVCSKKSSSVSVPTATFIEDQTILTVPHNLGFAPLSIAIYTDDPTWATYYISGLPPYQFFALAGLYVPRIGVNVSADSDNFYAYIQNTDTTRTVYVKFLGIIPPTITNAPELPLTDRNNTLLDEAFNYCKLVIDTSQSVNIVSGVAQRLTISHNLGYRPMSGVYALSDNQMYIAGQEFSWLLFKPYTIVASVDETNLYIDISPNSTATIRVFYRVYLDE